MKKFTLLLVALLGFTQVFASQGTTESTPGFIKRAAFDGADLSSSVNDPLAGSDVKVKEVVQDEAIKAAQAKWGASFIAFKDSITKGYVNNSYFSQTATKIFCGLLVVNGVVYLVDETLGLSETKDFIVENGEIIAITTGTLAGALLASGLYYKTETKALFASALQAADQNVVKAAGIVLGLAATVALINNTKIGALIKKNLIKAKKYVVNHPYCVALPAAAMTVVLAINAHKNGETVFTAFNPSNFASLGKKTWNFVKTPFAKVATPSIPA